MITTKRDIKKYLIVQLNCNEELLNQEGIDSKNLFGFEINMPARGVGALLLYLEDRFSISFEASFLQLSENFTIDKIAEYIATYSDSVNR